MSSSNLRNCFPNTQLWFFAFTSNKNPLLKIASQTMASTNIYDICIATNLFGGGVSDSGVVLNLFGGNRLLKLARMDEPVRWPQNAIVAFSRTQSGSISCL